MSIDIKKVLEELKKAEAEIMANPNFEADILEKAAAEIKAKEVDSEEGGSEGKVNKPKVLDGKETSEGKKDPNKDIPGARRIDHVAQGEEAGQLNGDSKNLGKEEMNKDNMPHPKDSPEDKAHDVIEESQPLKEAIKPLSFEDHKRTFFEHLRASRNQPDWHRDDTNQAVGKADPAADQAEPTEESNKITSISEKQKPKVPPKGSQIPLKGKISVDSVNKLVDAGYKPVFKSYQEEKETFFTELKKAGHKEKEKGVHDAAFMHDPRHTGTSEVGAWMAPGGAGKKTNEWAKGKHKEKLAELKSMPKPNLPKSELGKTMSPERKAQHQVERNVSNDPKMNEKTKGVHGSKQAGWSPAGAMLSYNKEGAKKEHKEKLAELKSMPKPNLPKKELEKAKQDNLVPSKHRAEARMKRVQEGNSSDTGVHSSASKESYAPRGHGSSLSHTRPKQRAGISEAGLNTRLHDKSSTPKQGVVDKLLGKKPEKGFYQDKATRQHKEKLAELKSMPKPNLPKSEMNKTEATQKVVESLKKLQDAIKSGNEIKE